MVYQVKRQTLLIFWRWGKRRRWDSNPREEITQALHTLYARLDTLASINAANILLPGGPQARHHELMEEAYAALGKVEIVIDELSQELEYQHKRLDEARDAALAEATPPKQEQQSKQPFGIDAADTAERVHEDWANDE